MCQVLFTELLFNPHVAEDGAQAQGDDAHYPSKQLTGAQAAFEPE